jgi:osmotically-inducible protein OsmY
MLKPCQSFSACAALVWAVSATGLPASDLDARIVTAAKNSYVFKTVLKNDKILVTSTNGRVVLAGAVPNSYHRTLAEDTVAGLPGVTDVRNQLQVAGEPSMDSPDGKLRAKIQAALLFHRNVSAARTRVFVKDGVVRLRGEADSVAQKSLTTEYVKDVEGVTQVINQMTVAKHPSPKQREIKQKIDDASITAQLKMALLLNRGTSALNTKVVTDGGIVTLTGKARSGAERELCGKIANDLDGVREVRNQMTVE